VVEPEVIGVAVQPGEHAAQAAPGVKLEERSGDRVLEFGIGPTEARAIALALHGKRLPRPMLLMNNRVRLPEGARGWSGPS
jgi:hypothetical protein